ncbi:hypothetical protein B0H66DRAFT_594768 [Apodospora peruviana]|uniref:Short-chain dehydrogenase n=1 Tax=Apodospora peruviana TaxID=516989 RepID=A0AAE0HW13_9PEZI|nr:hypothetical protein B0H66DRAFT_594768 [Apodospora peruviana]
MASLYSLWTQYFPPWYSAPVTEATLPNQSGKVFIVTGGSSGLGYELTRILYSAGGKVYVLTRSKAQADEAFAQIKTFYDNKKSDRGTLHFIPMDLTDFATVRSAAREFLAREDRLDVLFNNAGTGPVEKARPTAQNHEFHFAVNALGPFLLARLLNPVLVKTASTLPKGSVRVVWSASILVEMMAPPTGIRPQFLRDESVAIEPKELYSSTKTGCWFLAYEFMRRQQAAKDDAPIVLHIAGNPGNHKTQIWRHASWLLYLSLWLILRNPVHGAETYLWLGVSDDVTVQDAVEGKFGIPDGRWHPGQRADLVNSLKVVEEGGSGRAREFYEWCEERATEFIV